MRVKPVVVLMGNTARSKCQALCSRMSRNLKVATTRNEIKGKASFGGSITYTLSLCLVHARMQDYPQCMHYRPIKPKTSAYTKQALSHF